MTTDTLFDVETPTEKRPKRKVPDAVAAMAVETAMAALVDVVAVSEIGDHIGVRSEGDRMVVHVFECRKPGYLGWTWQVLVARAPRARVATVCDSWLEPGEHAIVAPPWVPWSHRLEPGDVTATDRLAYVHDDERLMPGYTATGDEDQDDLAVFELGLGRPRVLSPIGYSEAAKRWMKGEHGPSTKAAADSDSSCDSCGFYIPMGGQLRQAFGVCANGWSAADGSVVATGYGCGAHSETDVKEENQNTLPDPILDETGYDEVD